MPEISVIVPVYNTEKYLHRCIDSILAQTFTDFELILVDDGSTDNSKNICTYYSEIDKRVKVFSQENSGVSKARNVGIQLASGEYLLFIDSDDYVDSLYIERLSEKRCDFVICGMISEDENGNINYYRNILENYYDNIYNFPFGDYYENFILYSPYCKLFKRNIVEKYSIQFPEHLTWGEDGCFVSDYLLYARKIQTIEYKGYHYVKYNSINTLSNHIKTHILEMVCESREYCINNMQLINEREYIKVKGIIEEDIKNTCILYINRLFNNCELSIKEKITCYREFQQNSYVAEIIKFPEVYFKNNKNIYKAMQLFYPALMFSCYYILTRISCVHIWLFKNVYDHFPDCLKNIYRKIKSKIL